eukprot:jgi/Chrzof1/3228/Cz12g16220.t1
MDRSTAAGGTAPSKPADSTPVNADTSGNLMPGGIGGGAAGRGGFRDVTGGETGGFKDITGGETGGLSDLTGGQTGGFKDITGGTTGGLSDVRGDDRPGTGIMDQLKGLVDFGGNTGGVKDITGGTTGGVADITGGNSGDTSDVQGTKKPGDAWLVPPTSGRGDDEDTQT